MIRLHLANAALAASITIAFVTLMVPAMASASHISLPATWDFETPVNEFEWSSTTRTELSYFVIDDTPIGPDTELITTQYLGPLTTSSLALGLMDVFIEATPYRFSFDLILIAPTTLDGFSVTSHGNVLLEAADLDALQPEFTSFFGGSIIHFDSLDSPGPVPMGGPGSCCGDVVIEWSFPAGTQWGIDNFVLKNVPEPSVSLMLGLGLAMLARRR